MDYRKVSGKSRWGYRFLALLICTLMVVSLFAVPGVWAEEVPDHSNGVDGTVSMDGGSEIVPETVEPEQSGPPANETVTQNEAPAKVTPPAAAPKEAQMKATPQALESGIFVYEEIPGGVRILGFVAGQETTNLVIPDQLAGLPVTEIGDKAFMQANITNLTLGNNVKVVGEYAFTANTIDKIALPDSLKEIKAYAFRDNQITTLDTNKLEIMGKEAFANNKLTSLTFGNIVTIGDSAFLNNDLIKVTIPDSVTGYGAGVFAYNDRYVELVSTNPLIKTEITSGGFGQVVNPVTVTVHFVDQATGTQVVGDALVGDDLTRLDGLVLINEVNTYTPPTLTGYVPVQTPVSYTPDSTNYELTVYYKSTKIKPTIEVTTQPMIPEGGPGGADVLLSFVKATDLNGKDISDRITVEPTSIDTSVPGPVSVNYTVTDEFGNTTVKTVSVLVGTDWYDFPLGYGWVLGDFTYEGKKVTGFSASGKEKVLLQKNLVLPHINPADGITVIDTVAPGSFRLQGLVTVSDFADNIRIIEARYSATSSADRDPGGFDGNAITSVDLPSLEYAGRDAFKSNRLTSISFPNLEFLGASAFGYNRIAEIDLPKVKTVDVWGLGNNQLTDVTMPSLQAIDMAGFINNQIADIDLPQLTSLGANAFAANKLTSVTEEDIPSIVVVGNGSFRNNLITTIDLPNVTTIETNGFGTNPIDTIPAGGLDSLQTIGNTAFQNSKLAEWTIPNLQSIGTSAFAGNPGSADYNNQVVIWTDNEQIPSRENSNQ